MPKTIIISLGGSLIVPDDYDFAFLKKFRQLIDDYTKKNYRFVIICGGGKLARAFQDISSESNKLSNEELDWLGIYATKINANIVKSLFGDAAEDFIVDNPTKKIQFRKKIMVASGWKPGWSTDYDAVLLAKNFNSKEVVNMSNVDYVYDKDPRKHSDARKLENISWTDFLKMTGTKWKAGMNVPFDPIAAKEAKKLKIKTNIIGKDMNNLKNLLDSRKYKGTVIE